jgi:NAD(P)-dependent dehydrogenase (short-subunit alcohol dehydrogenase family)
MCLSILPPPVNVRGSFLITKYSLKLMKPRNYGRILLIASIAGKEVKCFRWWWFQYYY